MSNKAIIRDIGVPLEAPKESCNDSKCHFHGKISIRGRQFTGTVLSAKMRKTCVVEFQRLHFLKKYERYEKRRTRLKVHNPECIGAKEGDIVRVMESRPISKTKNFILIQKIGTQKGFKEIMEARQAAKVPKVDKEELAKSEEEK